MIILWIRKNDKDEPSRSNGNDEESFQKHDEHMKRFRDGHPRIEPVKPREVSPAGCFNSVPMQEVKLASYAQN